MKRKRGEVDGEDGSPRGAGGKKQRYSFRGRCVSLGHLPSHEIGLGSVAIDKMYSLDTNSSSSERLTRRSSSLTSALENISALSELANKYDSSKDKSLILTNSLVPSSYMGDEESATSSGT